MIHAAIQPGLTAAEHVQTERVRLRSDLEAMFLLVGLAGLDIIIAAERQTLAERFAARLNDQGFIS